MRSLRFLLAASLVAGGLAAAACATSEGSDEIGADAGTSFASPEGGRSGLDAGAPSTTIRLAHLAPDLGEIDFCFRVSQTGSFEGPVFGGGGGAPTADAGAEAGDEAGAGAADDAGEDAGDAADLDAGDGAAPGGLAYGAVSTYREIDVTGTITIAIVAKGASSCASPIVASDVTLDPGKLSTVLLLGRTGADASDGALGLVALTDDHATVADHARVRMVNAALGPDGASPIFVRAAAATGDDVDDLADEVDPRHASTASSTVPVDELGYATAVPLAPAASLAVGPASSAGAEAGAAGWQSAPADLGLLGGSLHTGFVLVGSPEGAAPYEVLWCTDTSTSGDRTTCTLVR